MENQLSEKVLFIGNGINRVTNKNSWQELLKLLQETVQMPKVQEDIKDQFPLLYENILSFGLKNGSIQNERQLKELISEQVVSLIENDIHHHIKDINPAHLITTNYDFTFEKDLNISNNSVIYEDIYSIFRRYFDTESGRTFWHVHGDCDHTNSINLGYEHYCGQMHQLRNYVTSGTNYSQSDYENITFIQQLKQQGIKYNSWVDYLFTKQVHIFGLRLDFIEIDLWWLLTFRARKLIREKDFYTKNDIYYYIPSKYFNKSRGKIEYLRNMGIETVLISGDDDKAYYHQVLNCVSDDKLRTQNVFR